MIIYARSPYFIEVNETSQLGSKIELRIWNNPDSKPTDATYTFTLSLLLLLQIERTFTILHHM